MERIGYVFARRIAPNIVGLLIILGVAGCDDPFEDLDNLEGAATLYSLSRPEHLGYPSALSLAGRGGTGAVVVEDAVALGWDVALTGDGGELMLAPGGAYASAAQGDGAIYMDADRTFEEVTEAPSDGRVFDDTTTVPLRLGTVYVVRSRSTPGLCSAFFSKLRVTEMDSVMASARFEYVVNPNCNARGLEPPEDEDDG